MLYNDVMRSLNLKVWYVYVGSLPQAPGDAFVAALIYCDMYYSLYVDHVNLYCPCTLKNLHGIKTKLVLSMCLDLKNQRIITTGKRSCPGT